MITLAGYAIVQLSIAAAPAPAPARADVPVARIAAPADVSRGRCDAVVDDGAMTAAILSRLSFSTAADSADVRISTHQGIVEIRGLTRTEADKAQIAAAAGDTYGVVSVNNRLDVAYWPPRTEAARLGALTRDAARLSAQVKSDDWIASALRYTLSFSRAIDTCGIDVSSVDGSVRLRGKIADASGIASATAMAKNTLGVRAVDVTGLSR